MLGANPPSGVCPLVIARPASSTVAEPFTSMTRSLPPLITVPAGLPTSPTIAMLPWLTTSWGPGGIVLAGRWVVVVGLSTVPQPLLVPDSTASITPRRLQPPLSPVEPTVIAAPAGAQAESANNTKAAIGANQRRSSRVIICLPE